MKLMLPRSAERKRKGRKEKKKKKKAPQDRIEINPIKTGREANKLYRNPYFNIPVGILRNLLTGRYLFTTYYLIYRLQAEGLATLKNCDVLLHSPGQKERKKKKIFFPFKRKKLKRKKRKGSFFSIIRIKTGNEEIKF